MAGQEPFGYLLREIELPRFAPVAYAIDRHDEDDYPQRHYLLRLPGLQDPAGHAQRSSGFKLAVRLPLFN